MVGRDWMDGHFGGNSPKTNLKPAAATVAKRSPVIIALWIFFGMGVAGAGGVITTDLMGITDLGIKELILGLPERKPIVSTRSPEPAKPIAPPDTPVTPPPEPERHPPATPEPALSMGPTEARATQLRALISQQQRGIDLMGRELAEVRAAEVAPRWETSFRTKRPRTRPWSAAERIDEIQHFAKKNPNMSAPQIADLQNQMDAAQADLANAQRRLRELGEKGSSLQGRIDKATSAAASANAELGTR